MAKPKKPAKLPKASLSVLAIPSKETGKLSPNQMAFNKLTARIEKLRQAIQRKERQLDTATQLYGTAIPLLEKQQVQQSRKLLELLMPFYRAGKIPKTLQPAFKEMLQDILQNVFAAETEDPDTALKAIFRELE